MLNIYYQVPISVLNPLKLKIKVTKVIKKEEPLSLNLEKYPWICSLLIVKLKKK